MMNNEKGFVGFEYMEVPAKRRMESLYVDCYRNFGWEFEGEDDREGAGSQITLRFKRDRKLRNKAELTRLRRQFEACAQEIEALERSGTTMASIAAFTAGLAGTALLGGAMFAYLRGLLPLMVVLAVPGFPGWIVPYFCYQRLRQKRERQIAPLIERKNDEIYSVCQRGRRLLSA